MNVNLDVLELIFAALDGSDLAAVARVSRAFLAGAIPTLYSSIEYTQKHAKRARSQLSPFTTLVAHPHLAVHVKRVALHAAPVFQPAVNLACPTFLSDLGLALRSTTNLRVFICTVKILPPLLPLLLDKSRLGHLRICASLGSRQVAVLQERTGLHSLALDFPSWNVVDALPKWAAVMQRSLAHLTLFMSQDTDAPALNATLAQLPRLRGLHVIGCPRITHNVVLRALSHTPDLSELSFSIFPTQDHALPPLNFPIPPLTHLSIDIRASYPGLKELMARIISCLSPRDALAICGGWIGEIRGSSELIDTPDPGPANGPPGPVPPAPGPGNTPNVHIWQSHVHPGTFGHDHPNGPPLLSPPNHHHGNPNLNQSPPNSNPIMFGPFPFPIGNPNISDDDDDPPGPDPPNPVDLNSPSVIASLPPSLSILHLPQISPTGLREVLDRCNGIQVLGIVIGNAFSSLVPSKSNSTTGRLKHTARSGVRPEANVLSVALSRAKALRELILDTSPADFSFNNGPSSSSGSRGSHNTSFAGYTLLTPLSVRMLMREAPLLRRIVGEGRIWESPTPTPSSPIPFPQCLSIDLTLTKARYGPGTGNSHVHGPPGFGSHGGGYGQMEASNDHWFWLTNSASGGRVYSGF